MSTTSMIRILLVEDNELNMDMLKRRLERKGFHVLTAHDGKQGLEKAALELPDIILMDLSLPVMDGWEASRRLKDGVSTKPIPILALSAHTLSGDREKALEAGCDDYDTKPINFKRVLDKIEALLQKAS